MNYPDDNPEVWALLIFFGLLFIMYAPAIISASFSP